MQKLTYQTNEYVLDRTWSILAVMGEKETTFHLLNKVSGTTKIIGTSPSDENIDSLIEQMIPTLRKYKDNIVFDKELVPAHLVDLGSQIWKDCHKEGEFIANLTYMLLGILMKAYSEIIETRAFPLEDSSSPDVATMKGIKKIGETLLSVEHRSGVANVAANNRTERI